MATYHVVLFVLVILHSYVQAGVLIDDFSLNRDVSISRLLNFSQVVDTPSDHSSFIGNQRTISMSKKEGSLGGSISIVLGYLAFSNDVRTQAIVDIDYRDISGDITPSLDFTENGADCFLVDVLASDQLHTISFIADTPEGPQTSEFSFSFGVEPPGTRLCLPYGGDLQAYDEVTSLHFSDEADSNGVDALYGFFCVAPSVSCWHEISPNGSEPILAGDTLSVTVHCENFVSLPPMNQPLDISVEFPPEIGTMDPSTFTCSTPDVPTITATPQRFLVSTDLLDNTTITCSFDIDLIAAGTVEGFAARVLNTRSGSVSFSNTGGNR